MAVQSRWKGGLRTDFHHKGRECILVAPAQSAPGRPWLWRCEFFGAFDAADIALLERGWHVAYIRLSDLYGLGGLPAAEAKQRAGGEAAAAGVELLEGVRARLAADSGLTAKPVLLGFSRGGLYALRYAGLYPERTGALYLDAPVVERRYRELGGTVRTILKPGGDHHPHGLPDAAPIARFSCARRRRRRPCRKPEQGQGGAKRQSPALPVGPAAFLPLVRP